MGRAGPYAFGLCGVAMLALWIFDGSPALLGGGVIALTGATLLRRSA